MRMLQPFLEKGMQLTFATRPTMAATARAWGAGPGQETDRRASWRVEFESPTQAPRPRPSRCRKPAAMRQSSPRVSGHPASGHVHANCRAYRQTDPAERAESVQGHRGGSAAVLSHARHALVEFASARLPAGRENRLGKVPVLQRGVFAAAVILVQRSAFREA